MLPGFVPAELRPCIKKKFPMLCSAAAGEGETASLHSSSSAVVDSLCFHRVKTQLAFGVYLHSTDKEQT